MNVISSRNWGRSKTKEGRAVRMPSQRATMVFPCSFQVGMRQEKDIHADCITAAEITRRNINSAGDVKLLFMLYSTFLQVLWINSMCSVTQSCLTVCNPRFLSMGSPRQEYWSGVPFPPPEDLPNIGIEPASLPSPALASGFFTTNATWEALWSNCLVPKLPGSHGWPIICKEVWNIKATGQ